MSLGKKSQLKISWNSYDDLLEVAMGGSSKVEHSNLLALLDRVLSTEFGVLKRLESNYVDRRSVAKGFSKNGADIRQFCEMINGYWSLANNPVDFFLCFLVCIGILNEVVEGIRQHPRSRLVAYFCQLNIPQKQVVESHQQSRK